MKYMLLNLCVYFPPINLSFVTGAIGQKILKGSGKKYFSLLSSYVEYPVIKQTTSWNEACLET